MSGQRNTQDAPYPEILGDLVSTAVLDPGWTIQLLHTVRDTGSPEQGEGLTLRITTVSYDTYHPEHGRNYRVIHDFPVIPATYNEQSWTRWLFDRYQDVIRHEGMEFFQVKGTRPYAPNHGPGNDPYTVRELTTDLDRRTQYTGGVDHK